MRRGAQRSPSAAVHDTTRGPPGLTAGERPGRALRREGLYVVAGISMARSTPLGAGERSWSVVTKRPRMGDDTALTWDRTVYKVLTLPGPASYSPAITGLSQRLQRGLS